MAKKIPYINSTLHYFSVDNREESKNIKALRESIQLFFSLGFKDKFMPLIQRVYLFDTIEFIFQWVHCGLNLQEIQRSELGVLISAKKIVNWKGYN